MSLPDSYTLKPGSIAAYFDAILDLNRPRGSPSSSWRTSDLRAQTTASSLASSRNWASSMLMEFHSSVTSISWIGLNPETVVAAGIRDAYSDLFAVNIKANELSATDVKNKLRTLYSGKKTDGVIDRIAKTFASLCEYADFSVVHPTNAPTDMIEDKKKEPPPHKKAEAGIQALAQPIALDSLQYHINIVLPETRDQGVYDAIFRSLREHLGTRHG